MAVSPPNCYLSSFAASAPTVVSNRTQVSIPQTPSFLLFLFPVVRARRPRLRTDLRHLLCLTCLFSDQTLHINAGGYFAAKKNKGAAASQFISTAGRCHPWSQSCPISTANTQPTTSLWGQGRGRAQTRIWGSPVVKWPAEEAQRRRLCSRRPCPRGPGRGKSSPARMALSDPHQGSPPLPSQPNQTSPVI